MPILPERPRKATDRLKSWYGQLDYALHSGGFLGLLVALVAILLAVLHIEFGYVAGAYLIVHGTTLVRKRVAPTVIQTQPEPPRPQPLRKLLQDEPKESVLV